MTANIVSILPDHEYGVKFRHGRFSVNPQWEWGMGEDGRLYCRDDSIKSIFTGEWFLVEHLQLNIDIETIHKLSKWISSISLKNKVKSFTDKEIMNALS